MAIHLAFDVLAALCALAMTAFVYRWRLAGSRHDPRGKLAGGYIPMLVAGAVGGAYAFGTMNLWLSGIDDVGRSVLGALVGAIAAVEFHKWRSGIRGSTGLIFVAAFSVSVSVGRVGCLLAGLDDQTHGIATNTAFGWDFGDGIRRHPVQLYESLSMATFLGAALWAFALRQPVFMAHGFHLLAIAYGTQRFAWEFLKPYATVLGPFNLFHVLSAVLVVYGVAMIARSPRHEPVPA